ncbi:hypothetical protein J5N97_018877 [Dioscorea zingiberensis]|uniref:Methyltransferase type 11 domain-containing protein n=1 Tax=Dioscorea zingiberensis TaxID=325984 RepID=A0A9D5CCX5_9LILI|nr:hypothetical protein J5N97_018877 [Dioscorea zingiberensis]
MATIADETQKEVTEFYDESAEFWENMWGEHMHQGFYDPGVQPSLSDSRSAQVRMVDEALRFAGVSDDPSKRPKRAVDVGCGIGGASFYIAKKYGAECHGINISSVQIQRAQALVISEGLADKVFFQVGDALEQPFPDNHFDLVWSMECAEHIPDKKKFMSELARVTAPGGIIIITGLCHRDLKPYEDSLPPEEDNVMNKINTTFYHPGCCSPSDYAKIAESLSLQDIKTADWSEHVAPFYPAVINSALTWETVAFLLQSGPQSRRRALGMPLMVEGYNMKVLKYAIITCRKPE